MANRTGCQSEEEYILIHEIPEEKRKALQELMQDKKSNLSYLSMIEYLHDKERFDIDKIRSFGLDVQYLVSIDDSGQVDVDAYVVGNGVFYETTDFGDYAAWNYMYVDDNGDVILPYCNYDRKDAEEELINLSKPDVDHDFRGGNVVENMLWCIQNMDVTALEDYKYENFGCRDGSIDFSMTSELLVKIIKPDAISTIYTDKMIELETLESITEFDEVKVFAKDFE